MPFCEVNCGNVLKYVGQFCVWCSWLRGLPFQICTRIRRSHFLKRKCDGEPCLRFVVMNCSLPWVNCDCFRIKVMYYHFNERSAMKAPLIADDVYEIIIKVILFVAV